MVTFILHTYYLSLQEIYSPSFHTLTPSTHTSTSHLHYIHTPITSTHPLPFIYITIPSHTSTNITSIPYFNPPIPLPPLSSHLHPLISMPYLLSFLSSTFTPLIPHTQVIIGLVLQGQVSPPHPFPPQAVIGSLWYIGVTYTAPKSY